MGRGLLPVGLPRLADRDQRRSRKGPAQSSTAPPEVRAGPSGPLKVCSCAVPDPRVLLLDADAVAGDVIAGVLERLGHATTRVTDPLEAIRRAHEFQLVVVDDVGEGADPVQVCRELRATPQAAAVPVLAVCPSDDVEERIKFL